MIVTTDSKQFAKDMKNILGYTEGFLNGVQAGKAEFLKNLGAELKEAIYDYVDTNARVDPAMLHHVYEWYQVGKPGARLFDIGYTSDNQNLTFFSTFSQSKSIKTGSNVPFYNKARIMEGGISVKIKPTKARVLRFEEDGKEFFVSGSVEVKNPGGSEAEGGFKKVFESFFKTYLTQSFLRASGIEKYLQTPELYRKNLSSAKRGGKSLGYTTGYRWISGAAGGAN
jgi:hypothetical protein